MSIAIAVINVILWVLAVAVLGPVAVFCVECAAALLPRRSRNSIAIDEFALPRTVVLIPAHNEESVIGQTLESILDGRSAYRVLVVADNCDDRTAELARGMGAEAIERRDLIARGKGFALNFGISLLQNNPPEVVVVIDADCISSPADIETLVKTAWREQRPAQALNLTDRAPAAGPTQTISLLANCFMNLVRPRGLARLGLPCRLTGTGMAIPWSLLNGVGFSGSIVEDMQLGIDLSIGGHAPVFCPEARVTSAMPVGNRAFISQRTRWEHGQLRTTASQAPRLLAMALARRSALLMAIALDICIPPLTLLVAGLSSCAILALAAIGLGASWMPAAVLAAGGAAMAAVLWLNWIAFCRKQVPLRAVWDVPKYIFRKAPIYFNLIFNRQNVWVRTDRDCFTLSVQTKE